MRVVGGGRWDEGDDAEFYAVPRLVTHIEPGAIEALRGVYDAALPVTGMVLDLMSSWRSHLPERVARDRVVGLGMNSTELAANPQVGSSLAHDLNRQPLLPFRSGAFGAVVCAVSVQYLVQPVEVFAEVRRVLTQGGPVVVSFSNRCFPTKAVEAWLSTGDSMHRRLVRAYVEDAGFADVRDVQVPTADDPLWVVSGRR